jgi:hypothetical protein
VSAEATPPKLAYATESGNGTPPPKRERSGGNPDKPRKPRRKLPVFCNHFSSDKEFRDWFDGSCAKYGWHPIHKVSSSTHTHPYSAARRAMIEQLIHNYALRDGHRSALDLGGNWKRQQLCLKDASNHALAQQRLDTWTCSPLTRRNNKAASQDRHRHAEWEDYCQQHDIDPTWCLDLAHECFCHEVDCLISVHSLYYISPSELITSMVHNGVTQCYAGLTVYNRGYENFEQSYSRHPRTEAWSDGGVNVSVTDNDYQYRHGDMCALLDTSFYNAYLLGENYQLTWKRVLQVDGDYIFKFILHVIDPRDIYESSSSEELDTCLEELIDSICTRYLQSSSKVVSDNATLARYLASECREQDIELSPEQHDYVFSQIKGRRATRLENIVSQQRQEHVPFKYRLYSFLTAQNSHNFYYHASLEERHAITWWVILLTLLVTVRTVLTSKLLSFLLKSLIRVLQMTWMLVKTFLKLTIGMGSVVIILIFLLYLFVPAYSQEDPYLVLCQTSASTAQSLTPPGTQFALYRPYETVRLMSDLPMVRQNSSGIWVNGDYCPWLHLGRLIRPPSEKELMALLSRKRSPISQEPTQQESFAPTRRQSSQRLALKMSTPQYEHEAYTMLETLTMTYGKYLSNVLNADMFSSLTGTITRRFTLFINGTIERLETVIGLVQAGELPKGMLTNCTSQLVLGGKTILLSILSKGRESIPSNLFNLAQFSEENTNSTLPLLLSFTAFQRHLPNVGHLVTLTRSYVTQVVKHLKTFVNSLPNKVIGFWSITDQWNTGSVITAEWIPISTPNFSNWKLNGSANLCLITDYMRHFLRIFQSVPSVILDTTLRDLMVVVLGILKQGALTLISVLYSAFLSILSLTTWLSDMLL